MPTLITLAVKNWRIVLSAGLALVLVFFAWHYNSIINQNKALKAELAGLNDSISALNKLSAKRAEIVGKTDTLINQIDTEARDNDALTHDILINAINRLQ